jgi:hypothetical protein
MTEWGARWFAAGLNEAPFPGNLRFSTLTRTSIKALKGQGLRHDFGVRCVSA